MTHVTTSPKATPTTDENGLFALPPVVTSNQILKRLAPLSAASFNRLVRDGKFPAPTALSGRGRLWTVASVNAFITTLSV